MDTVAREKAAKYVPGYDWIPDKFGPPPGIAKARKDEFGKWKKIVNLLFFYFIFLLAYSFDFDFLIVPSKCCRPHVG